MRYRRKVDPDAQRYVLGSRFGWSDLMDAARQRAREHGERQLVIRDGATWLITTYRGAAS